MKTLTVIVLDYAEFDALVNEKVYNGEEVSECVADNEWSNDEDHLYEFNQTVYDIDLKEGSYYRTYEEPQIKKGETVGVASLLTYMFEHSLLDKGNYLIEVSW